MKLIIQEVPGRPHVTGHPSGTGQPGSGAQIAVEAQCQIQEIGLPIEIQNRIKKKCTKIWATMPYEWITVEEELHGPPMSKDRWGSRQRQRPVTRVKKKRYYGGVLICARIGARKTRLGPGCPYQSILSVHIAGKGTSYERVKEKYLRGLHLVQGPDTLSPEDLKNVVIFSKFYWIPAQDSNGLYWDHLCPKTSLDRAKQTDH